MRSAIRAMRQFLGDAFKLTAAVGIILGGFVLYAKYMVYDDTTARQQQDTLQPIRSFNAGAAPAAARSRLDDLR
ncbi:MAG TPA: hypothetical protein VGN72_13410 [Tepidisphaeraceae bacterium]|jgi:hypothetical protein|nr:hypothetical protein [Tepidisphaeraceae bacterium]